MVDTIKKVPIVGTFRALQVLLRALRDFNLGKLTSDDTSIFLGLLNDLFPKTLELVPRAVEKEFETVVSAARCVVELRPHTPRPAAVSRTKTRRELPAPCACVCCRSRQPPQTWATSRTRPSA